jgi:hypothetical protein
LCDGKTLSPHLFTPGVAGLVVALAAAGRRKGDKYSFVHNAGFAA